MYLLLLLFLLHQVYSLAVSVLLHCDHNLLNTALEMMEQLLWAATAEFTLLLISSLPSFTSALSYWPVDLQESFLDESFDASSQLDTPLDSYFAPLEEQKSPSSSSSSSSTTTSATSTSSSATTVPTVARTHGEHGSGVDVSVQGSQGSGCISPTNSVDSWTPSLLHLVEGACMTCEGEGKTPLPDLHGQLSL